MKVYLAGPILGMTPEAAYAWRYETSDSLREAGYNVFIPKPTGCKVEDGVYVEDLEEGANVEDIFYEDYGELLTCGSVLANFLGAERVSIGTLIELTLAYELGKEVLVVTDLGNVNNHPFMSLLADYIFMSTSDAIKFLVESAERRWKAVYRGK